MTADMAAGMASVSFVDQVNILLQTEPAETWPDRLCALLGAYTAAHVLLTDEKGDTLCRRRLPEEMSAPRTPEAYPVSLTLPIYAQNKQAGALTLFRGGDHFNENERMAASVTLSVLTVALFYVKEQQEAEHRRRTDAVKAVLNTLSFSELEAVILIFQRLDGGEGLLVAGRVADELGMTRSVVVNALRKLEGTGMVEARSLGMKGTYIRVHNPLLLDEIRKLKH